MATAEPQTAKTAASDKPIPAWRYNTGLGLFIFGNILFFASPVVVPALGLSATYIAVGIIAAEVIMFSSAFFLGWSGMKQLKDKMLGFFKYKPEAQPVSRFRHDLGIFLVFVLAMALDLAGIALVFIAFAQTTPADPFPIVLGLNYDQLAWIVAGLFIGAYVSLVVGLFVLGDHWWGRFRDLMVWQPPEAASTK